MWFLSVVRPSSRFSIIPYSIQIIFTNVGNPYALGQKPLTFPRQVVALCQAPFLLDDPNVGLLFLADAIAKAKLYLSYTAGGLGAYSDSRRLPGIRKEVAEFIGRRDGYPSDPELIYLTDGASKGVMQILQTVIRGAGDGAVMKSTRRRLERELLQDDVTRLEQLPYYGLLTR